MFSNQSIKPARFYWEFSSLLNVKLEPIGEQKGKVLLEELLLEDKQIFKIHNRDVFIRCLLLNTVSDLITGRKQSKGCMVLRSDVGLG